MGSDGLLLAWDSRDRACFLGPAQSGAYAAAKQRFQKQSLHLKAYEATEINVGMECLHCQVSKKRKKNEGLQVAGGES